MNDAKSTKNCNKVFLPVLLFYTKKTMAKVFVLTQGCPESAINGQK